MGLKMVVTEEKRASRRHANSNFRAFERLPLPQNPRLLHAFRLGERAALEEVYRQYSPAVLKFLRGGFGFRSGGSTMHFKGIHNDSDLNSSVQEVFRRAFEEKARHSYNGTNSFTNWVLAIARNMVLNGFRRREVNLSEYIKESDHRNQLTFMDDEMTEEHSGILYGEPAPCQSMEFESSELRELMLSFMDDLEPEERLILKSRFVDGLGQKEAAKELGLTRMKIRVFESKLRRRLHFFLKPSGYLDHLPKAQRNRW